MGCGCKGEPLKVDEKDLKINYTILNGIFNFIIVMFFLIIISPIILIGVTYLVFNQTVLNKENKVSDIVKIVLLLKNKFFKEKDDDDEDDDDDLENYEVITEKWVKNE